MTTPRWDTVGYYSTLSLACRRAAEIAVVSAKTRDDLEGMVARYEAATDRLAERLADARPAQ